MERCNLKIPKPRKSVEVINALREANFSATLDSSPLPNATSTVEKRGCESLMDPYMVADSNLHRKVTQGDCLNYDESSLGLLDMDKDLEGMNLISKMQHEFRSLSFNAKEMSGRSTLHSESKENKDPGKPSLRNNNLCIEDILHDANKQSQAVDDILKASDNPNVANIRMSLESYKQSISGMRTVGNETWNFRPDDFGLGNIREGGSDLRDSMFTPANKIDFSKEELSWMRDHGDFPVHPTSATFTSGSDDYNSNRQIATLPNDTVNDFTGLKSSVTNLASMSKISFVGNYFQGRSENINRILSAPSPEKVGPFPPLFNPEDDSNVCENLTMSNAPTKMCETYSKSKSHAPKSLPFHTLSDDSEAEDDQQTTRHDDVAVLTNPKCSNICKDITNTIIDEISYSSPISCSQIKKFVAKYDTEKRSILLDNLLAEAKQKVKMITADTHEKQKKSPKGPSMERSPNRLLKEKSPRSENKAKSPRGHDVSPTLPEKSSFGYTSNIFHSTKHDETLANKDLRPNNKTKICGKSTKSEMSQSLNSCGNEDFGSDFVSTLKNYGKSHSGSSGFTESSVKSAATVVQVKHSNPLRTINENGKMNPSSIISPNKDSGVANSTGILNQNEVTSSDGSKEILNLMSPASSGRNNKSSPINAKAFPVQCSSKKSESEDWVSPMKAKLNNLSKECIPSETPYKVERLNSALADVQFENPDLTDCSLNVPFPGDWICAESKDDVIVVGTPHNVNIKLTSLSRRWILVKFSVNSLHVDDELYNEADISQVILVQALTTPILLKVDSQMMCTLKAIALVPNKLLKININLNLTDMVTRTESTVKHDIILKTKLPQLELKCDSMKSDTIHFPSLPQGINTYLPITLFNDSNYDLPIHLSISCPHNNVFSIENVSILPRDDIKEHNDVEFEASGKMPQLLSSTTEEHFIIPKDNSVCFRILLNYRAPFVVALEKLSSIQYVDAIMNITTVSQWKADTVIPLKRLTLIGGIGVSTLLIKNKQGSNALTINQGSSEVLWLFNDGTLNTHYKIFIGDHYNKYDNQTKLPPCKNPVFVLDKNEMYLGPGEKTCVNVHYPTNSEHVCGELLRTLAFASSAGTELFDLIGLSMTRSVSQQSGYSMDSAASQPQDICVKSTYRELSWGSLKIGSSEVKDLAIKNISHNKKIRIVASINEDCFKLLGENGPVSTLLFTLLPQECKTLRIEFRPSKSSGFIGSLRILHRSKASTNLLNKIMLHGVGDVSTLVFKDGVFRHGGSQGITLGSLNEPGDIKDIHFSIWNKGTASAFVMMHLDLKWKYRTLREEINVIPQCGIVRGNGIMRCVVRVPRRAVILTRGRAGDTENLATLTILHGDDSTRQRIKRICSENVIDESVKEIWNQESQGKLSSLCMHFPEEDQNYGNIKHFKESPAVLKLLLDELEQKEVCITYDIDLDNTIMRASSEFDESVHFQTMYADNTQDTVSSEL